MSGEEIIIALKEYQRRQKKIREHIKSFPHRKSHYSQKDNRKRKYLSENLSISRMYGLYLQKYEPQVSETVAKPHVKQWLYRKIFNEEFNLSFGYPCSDTCEKCDQMNSKMSISLWSIKRKQVKAIVLLRRMQMLQSMQQIIS